MRWGPLLLGVLGTAASYSPRVSSGRPGQRAALRSLREHSSARTQGQTNRAVARASNPRLVLLDQPELLTPVLEAVDEFFRQSPVTAAAMTCGAKAAASDSITQKRANLLEVPFCWSRNRAFMIYGAIYQGCVQHFLYNDFYVRLFGDSTSVGTVLEKVAFDNLVHVPLLCLPTLYLLKAAIFEQPLADGLQRYLSDARGELLWKYWAIWTPAQCLTFSVVPEHLRTPFVALVSFFWLMILSVISSRPTDGAEGPIDGGPAACAERASRQER